MIKKRTGEIIVTNEKQNKALKKLYGTLPGRIALKVLTHPLISIIAGAFMDSRLSRPLIDSFIRQHAS